VNRDPARFVPCPDRAVVAFPATSLEAHPAGGRIIPEEGIEPLPSM